MSELVPCPECQRHVRKTETRCPFCGEALSLTHVPSPALPTRRLGRAATFAFGAGIVGATALVGCGGKDDGGDMKGPPAIPAYGGPPTPIGGASGNIYGGPPSGMASGGNLTAGTASFGGSGPVYGAPTAGTPGLGGAQPVYGAPAAGTGNEPVGGAGGAGGDAAAGFGGDSAGGNGGVGGN